MVTDFPPPFVVTDPPPPVVVIDPLTPVVVTGPPPAVAATGVLVVLRGLPVAAGDVIAPEEQKTSKLKVTYISL